MQRRKKNLNIRDVCSDHKLKWSVLLHKIIYLCILSIYYVDYLYTGHFFITYYPNF